jgi:hypothetical protein
MGPQFETNHKATANTIDSPIIDGSHVHKPLTAATCKHYIQSIGQKQGVHCTWASLLMPATASILLVPEHAADVYLKGGPTLSVKINFPPGAMQQEKRKRWDFPARP